jgi:ribosome-associated protein
MVRHPALDPILAAAVGAAEDKKAEDVSVLDLRGLSDVTDFFVICHGRSSRQVQSISDGIEQALRQRRRRPSHIEGYARGEWILMDYLDVVIHVFTAERRQYYGLDRLWADAPRLPSRAGEARGPWRAARAASGDAAAEEETGG